MLRAIGLGATARTVSPPNPWVGCVIEPGGFIGSTQLPGGPHAEIVALRAAGQGARGATLYCTLESCSHHGRTAPCADAVIDAGVGRVVVGLVDPDPRVSGGGIQRLRDAGLDVDVGVCAPAVSEQLRPYLKHRTSGHPWVVEVTSPDLDEVTSPDLDVDQVSLPLDSDAVVLAVEAIRGGLRVSVAVRRPSRSVLELEGDAREVLAEIGHRGVIELAVERHLAGPFRLAGLVDRSRGVWLPSEAVTTGRYT